MKFQINFPKCPQCDTINDSQAVVTTNGWNECLQDKDGHYVGCCTCCGTFIMSISKHPIVMMNYKRFVQYGEVVQELMSLTTPPQKTEKPNLLASAIAYAKSLKW